MRRIKSVLICLLLTLSVLAMTACSGIDFDYNVSFSVDGKIIATVGTDGDKITMPKNPEKEDFVFDGWFWDEGEWNKPFTLNSILDQPIQETNNFTVYAKWRSSVNYKIVFNANGGSGEMQEQTASNDASVTINANAFTPPQDRVFANWNTKSDGSGESYPDGAQVTNLCNAGETVTLYAQWRERERFYYTVVFNANGGNGAEYSQSVETDSKVMLDMCLYSAPVGSVFAEWNTKADGTGVSYGNRAEIENLCEADGSITLYAQWRSLFYTVKYDANGGNGKMEDDVFLAGITDSLCRNSFKRKYFGFTGWNTQSNGSGTSYADNAVIKDICEAGKEITLYAQWKLDDGVTLINGKNDLEKVRTNLNGTFVLNADIDYGGQNITPLSGTKQFNGVFDGNGHTIKNYKYIPQNPDFYSTVSGFFGEIGYEGIVRNLSLTEFTMEGYTVGAFADNSYGLIENCYANGKVVCKTYGFSGAVSAGGVVGGNHGIVRGCLFAGAISVEMSAGVVHVGGVTGLNMLKTENCLCTGSFEIKLSGSASYEPVSRVSYDYYQLGVSENNYYYSGMSITLYRNGVQNDCEINKDAKSASQSKLDSSSFYTQSLKWDKDDWDFSSLDFLNGKYPVIRTNSF